MRAAAIASVDGFLDSSATRARHPRPRRRDDRRGPVHPRCRGGIPHLAHPALGAELGSPTWRDRSDLAQDFGMRMITRFDVDWAAYGYDDAALRDLVEFTLRTMLSFFVAPNDARVPAKNCDLPQALARQRDPRAGHCRRPQSVARSISAGEGAADLLQTKLLVVNGPPNCWSSSTLAVAAEIDRFEPEALDEVSHCVVQQYVNVVRTVSASYMVMVSAIWVICSSMCMSMKSI